MRYPDWPTRLHDFFLQRDQTPFRWGVNDCALFACDGILSMTGIDIALDFRGRYKSKAGALKAIRTITGGTTLADTAAYAATKYNLTQISPLLASRGDLVLMPNGADTLLALVRLNGREVAAVGGTGLASFPLQSAIKAWRV